MAEGKLQNAVGFPPPLLGSRARRLPILGATNEWVALAKPAEVGVREHPWNGGLPDLDAALNRQLQDGKPELLRLGASTFGSVYYLEPEVSGVSLFGISREQIASLRNVYGSGHFQFSFVFIAKDQGLEGSEVVADAPLLPHHTKPKMIPSTAKGKRASTHFQRIAESKFGWSLWRARTNYLRPHQIRAHAPLVGLSLLGDGLYEGTSSPTLKDLDARKRGPGVLEPLFEGIGLHLAAVSMPALESSDGPLQSLQAPLPSRFEGLLRRLGLEYEG